MAIKNSRNYRLVLLLLPLSITFPQGIITYCCLSLRSTVTTTTVTPGSHCPFRYASSPQEKRNEHHCPMHSHTEKPQRQELRCNCCPSASPTSPSDISVARFLLPCPMTDEIAPNVTRLYVVWSFPIASVTLVPPDPPPRTFALALL